MYEGLTTVEVEERVKRGEVNIAPKSLTRSIPRIIWDNFFNLFNVINIILAILVVGIGDYKNALFIAVAVANTLLGGVQEIRSKLTIDKLSIITQAKCPVIRNGERLDIPQEEIVLGDLMIISMGHQICSDGEVLSSRGLEVDEALLTGESETVIKEAGDEVFSGSFVVAGEAYVRVTAVGSDNYAHKIAENASYEKKSNSQLMHTLTFIIKIVAITIVPLGLALFASKYFLGHDGYAASMLAAVTAVGGMIPQGLVLLTGVAFSVGAFNLARHNTLTQSVPSIETLARVDVLCLDKTGTITDGTLTVHEVIDLGDEAGYAERALAEFVVEMPDNNSTSHALHEYLNPSSGEWMLEDSVAFSSERKWSSNTFAGQGSFVLGAPEFVFSGMSPALTSRVDSYATQGFRVLLLARTAQVVSGGELPSAMEPLALVIISDTVRATAHETFSFFRDQEVTIKVISGDDPRTVSTIASQAGIEGAENYADMSEFEEGADLTGVMEENTVFGRVSPYQKREMLTALKRDGHTVAMTGDGVNDVMALREADVGVAMASGSDAARTVSDFVLVDSNFANMVEVVKEGRRVVNNIEGVASLYLVKTIYSALLAIVFIFLPGEFPLEPVQLSLISTFMVGLPSFFLTLEPNYKPVENRFGDQIYTDALPAALAVVFNLVVVQAAGRFMHLSYQQISTLSVVMIAVICIVLLFRVSRPLNWKKLLMNLFFIAAFVAGFVADLTVIPALLGRQIFDLAPIFNQLALVWVPLAILAPALYFLLTKLVVWIRAVYLNVRGKGKASAGGATGA